MNTEHPLPKYMDVDGRDASGPTEYDENWRDCVSCPATSDDGWEVIDKREMERQQLIYIFSLIKDTLYTEYSRQSEEIEHIVRDMDIKMKYKTITITIKKIKKMPAVGFKDTIKTAAKNALYACSEVAALHPLKTIGAVAVVLKFL